MLLVDWLFWRICLFFFYIICGVGWLIIVYINVMLLLSWVVWLGEIYKILGGIGKKKSK